MKKLVYGTTVPLAAMAGFLGHALYVGDDSPAPVPTAATAPITVDAGPDLVVALAPADGQRQIVEMQLDGLHIFPGVIAEDSRPICDAAGTPLTLRLRIVWSDGEWQQCSMVHPLFEFTSFELGPYGGTFSIRFSPREPYGDVNGSGSADTGDMAIIKRSYGPIHEDLSRTICDLNRDGIVDAADLELCRQAAESRPAI